jgi:hypothetical protein
MAGKFTFEIAKTESVVDVLKVPGIGSAALRSYTQVPMPVMSFAIRIGRAAFAQLLPRIWNSSVFMAPVARRHHGNPFVAVLSVAVVSPPKMAFVVHSGCGAPVSFGPVPPSTAEVISASTVPVVFFLNSPVMVNVVHSIVPRLVVVLTTPTFVAVNLVPTGTATPFSTTIGLLVADATAGIAAQIVRTISPREAEISLSRMRDIPSAFELSLVIA